MRRVRCPDAYDLHRFTSTMSCEPAAFKPHSGVALVRKILHVERLSTSSRHASRIVLIADPVAKIRARSPC